LPPDGSRILSRGGTISRHSHHTSFGGFMKEDRPPLTFRQQGIIAAAMCAAMIGFYTLLGVL